MNALNETHDATLQSWVASANVAGTDFPIQNLPYGVFRRRQSGEAFRVGVAIGDQILDLTAVRGSGAFADADAHARRALDAAASSCVNDLMALGQPAWSALRLALSRVLREGAAQAERLASALVPQADAEYAVPARIRDYTDFYTSIHHATTVGKQFRPDNPLLPNYKWVPIGYHGRASSIVISGCNFRRPVGQTKAPTADVPVLGPAKRLDYELEVGVYIGTGNALGDAVSIEDAESHVFGFGLFNDWSARDIQGWEYQPLGPFLAKNFASTLSPWIVTVEALAPYRQAWTRAAGDPQPLPYLDSPALRESGAFDVALEVYLSTKQMRERGLPPERLSQSNFSDAYWSVSQMVAHHTVNGCNLAPGDLLGTGTLSGPAPEAGGSLLELSSGGKQPLTLASGETRSFLEDGDEVIFRGHARRDGFAHIGFGEARGEVLPAREVS
jgi:fumarylacetoacetase